MFYIGLEILNISISVVFNRTFNSFSYSMVIEVRIVIISIGKKQEIKQICKLYSIIEGDEWCGKKQHEED